MWDTLGFRESPYSTNPLRVLKEDVDLLVGREKEANELCTALESARQGVLIVSGAPGVGKTSFLNTQQYLLETEQAIFGPRLMAARQLCPVQPTDDARTLGLRALDSLYRSVEAYCSQNGKSIPSETSKIGKWLRSTGNSGFDLGIEILGFGGSFGRHVELPSVNDISFESITDAITCLVSEVVSVFAFEGVVIALDNLENLEEETLGRLLISFRDTLFSIENLWWILIGQSGLGSFVQSLDPRVFERMTGSGIEIKPITLDELDEAIRRRVQRFHTRPEGKAPLPKSIHKVLFEASFGEMRFVFKYSNTICTKFVEDLRDKVTKMGRSQKIEITRPAITELFDKAIGTHLVENQIAHEQALALLKQIIKSELDGLFLKDKEKKVLHAIGEKGKARAKDYKDFGVKTMQNFSSNYLSKFRHQNLLIREQEGRAVNYRLRGVAQISSSFGLLMK